MRIDFFCNKHLLGAVPSPVPAVKAIPDYFRKIKPQNGPHPEDITVKKCVPFLDALSAGFIIPLWCDVYVFARNGQLTVDFPSGFMQSTTLGKHSISQIPDHPFSKNPYGDMPLKWENPWIVKTEPGVSCLFTAPLNHLEKRFKILDGVVDTDTYYNNVNFPFLWTYGDGEFVIPKGTPLVQVIPFRREPIDCYVSSIDQDAKDKTRSILGTSFKDKYRNSFWDKNKNSENSFHKESIQEAPSALEVLKTSKEIHVLGTIKGK